LPIYDARARSLRHMLVLDPLSQMVGRAAHVGGTITTGSRGTLVVRALDSMSFSIGAGDRVGLIGHNGAGKTTLLRVLAGIYEPTAGTFDSEGRVMPLFNVMEGSMPDASGREFIAFRSVLLGLKPAEIDEVTEDVIAFCELGPYIDMPIRTYSTGMLVRLAFAITTAVTADILLFDELIGAGDARFYEKAKGRLQEFIQRSRVMVVATHSRDVLYQWCTRAFLLEHGKLVHDGPVDETLKVYDERRAADESAR
jgi:ABC-2 type transport system ATP-binding protein/lipopolysaccharide transport system ATP-binding protein